MSDLPFPEMNDVPSLYEGPITKQRIHELAVKHTQPVLNGEETALAMYLKAKAAAEFIQETQKIIEPMAMEEAEKYHKNESSMYGMTFNVASGAQKYDYSHDPTWVQLNEKLDEIKEKIKRREDLMKKAMDFSGVVDEDGVEIPAARVIGGTKSSLRVSIPKS